MSNVEKPSEPQLVACDICLKEIPVSEAKVAESADYVAHFCGLECFEQWQKTNDQHKDQARKA
ncbi:MAG: DUF3330 domain-containing protein [Burkholderiaceae bacterium]|nr:DUF3330 domain-containing protein [Burkholderiaceae bacterium]